MNQNNSIFPVVITNSDKKKGLNRNTLYLYYEQTCTSI